MIRLTTLGAAELSIDDVALPPAAGRVFALLLYCCLGGGRPISRTRLQALLFSDGLNRDEPHALRQLIYKLRKFGAPVETDGTDILLPIEAVQDDARDVISRGRFSDAELDAVAHGYLGTYAPTISESFSTWLDEHRAATSMQLCRVLVVQTAKAKQRHDWPSVDRAARACLALDPLNEAAMIAMSEALVMIGSKSQAMARLDSYLSEIGPGTPELRTQAAMLRRRIAERTPAYSPASIGEVALVGRGQELQLLVDAFAAARTGRPEVVQLSGEAGVGKSRLVEEFARLLVLDDASVITIRVRSSDERRPLSAFYDGVRQIMALPGALGCSPESMQYLTRFARLSGDPGMKIDEIERESELLFANIRAAIHDLLAAVASEAPLALIVEDAHWLDTHSMLVLEEILGFREGLPVCAVLTFRTRGAGSVSRRLVPGITPVPLSPLDTASTAKLVDLLLRSPERTSVELKNWLVETAAGLPLYARLLVQHFETTGQAFDVPGTLSSLIALQLDELSATARKLIEAVTVLGRYSRIDRLQRLLELRQVEFLSAVQELEDRRLLLHDGPAVRTAHALLEENVLEKMVPLVGMVLHREVALMLESEIGTDSAHVPWDCAQHWTKAGEPARAIAAMRTCARHALALGQSAEACAVLESLERDQLEEGSRIAINEELSGIAEATAEWRFVSTATSRLLNLNDYSLPRPREEYALMRLEALHRTGIDSMSDQEEIRKIMSGGGLHTKLRLRAATLALARADEAIHLDDVPFAYSVGSAIVNAELKDVSELEALGFSLVYDASFGDMDRASLAARRLVEISREAPTPGLQCRCRVNAGIGLFRAGFAGEATDALLDARDIAVTHRLNKLHFTIISHLCECARWIGDRSNAKKYLSEASAFLMATPTVVAGPLHSWNLAVDHAMSGRFNHAEAVISESEAHFPAIRIGKKRVGCEALRLYLRVGRRETVLLDDVESVVLLYERAKTLWLDDIIVIAISEALAFCGEASRSEALVLDYVTNCRRSRLPFKAVLRPLD